MALHSYTSRTRLASLLAATTAFALVTLPSAAGAQTMQQQATYSSSSTRALLVGEDIDGVSLAEPAAPQYGGGGYGGYKGYHDNSRWSHLAFEAGGGFTAPIGNDVNGGFTTAIGDGNRYGTDGWGGNILVGAGWTFSKRFTVMGEYAFNDNKIPGKTLSAVYNSDADDFEANGITNLGGNVHTNSVSAEPIFNYIVSDKKKYGAYVLGGVGWYHKTINFTAPIIQESFYGEFLANENINSYSDNAIGFNFGTGVSYKPFGGDSKAKLFAEVRYIFANTPSEKPSDFTNPDVLHTGTEELLPVTVGIRF